MHTTAYEFRLACEAGLILSGVEDKKPVWIGLSDHWKRYGQLVEWFERTGTLAPSLPSL